MKTLLTSMLKTVILVAITFGLMRLGKHTLLFNQNSFDSTEAKASSFENERNHPLFSPEFYRFITLGNTQSAVDWYLIKTVKDSDLNWIPSGTRSVAYRYFDLMTKLDPLFYDLYFFAANYLTVAKNDNQSALELAHRGRKFYEAEGPFMPQIVRETYWNNHWKLNLVEGYIQLFELQNIQGAMEAYTALADTPGIALGLKRILNKIQTAEGRLKMGFNSVMSMLESTRSDLDRERITHFKNQLRISAFLLTANRMWSEYLQTRKIPRSRADEKLWKLFLKTNNLPLTDPIGGALVLRPDKKIWTQSEWKPLVGEELEF